MSRRQSKETKYDPYEHLRAGLITAAILTGVLLAGVAVVVRALAE